MKRCHAIRSWISDFLGRVLFPCVAWLLLLIALLTVCSGIYEFSKGASFRETLLFPSLFISLSAALFTQKNKYDDSRKETSKFHLDYSVRAYEEAVSLLSDGNNQRVIWIAAARAITIASELADKVELSEHKKVLELEQMRYRRTFSGFLQRPAAFFYGVPWQGKCLDDAAALSSETRRETPNTDTGVSREIPEHALLIIWRASEWPEESKERAIQWAASRFSGEEHGRLTVLYSELQHYIDYVRTHRTAFGKVTPIS